MITRIAPVYRPHFDTRNHNSRSSYEGQKGQTEFAEVLLAQREQQPVSKQSNLKYNGNPLGHLINHRV